MREILALIVLIVADLISLQVVAEPIKHPDCVDALEQIVVLRMPVSVYIEEDRFHRDITASERHSELARLTKIVRLSCGKDPKVRAQQDIDARQLYVARSPECRFVWARYAAMMTPGSRFTHEEIEHQKAIMDEKCPATRRSLSGSPAPHTAHRLGNRPGGPIRRCGAKGLAACQ